MHSTYIFICFLLLQDTRKSETVPINDSSGIRKQGSFPTGTQKKYLIECLGDSCERMAVDWTNILEGKNSYRNSN